MTAPHERAQSPPAVPSVAHASAGRAPLIVWLVGDGRPGHRSQLEGLRSALDRRVRTESFWLDALPTAAALGALLWRRVGTGTDLPRPQVIVVAGHRTHLTGLAARRAHGGVLVNLMRPSLPGWLFDLCVVPEHDRAPRTGRTVRTLGALNPMRPGEKRSGSAAILVGGEGRHYRFDPAPVIDAIGAIVSEWSDAIVTDSRRTPPPLRLRLAELGEDRYRPWESCPPGWMAETLAHVETAWITADSVSMVYEALTAGCATGVIELPPVAAGGAVGKMQRGLQSLRDGRRVVTFDDFRVRGIRPTAMPEPLAEADTVAELVLDLVATAAVR